MKATRQVLKFDTVSDQDAARFWTKVNKTPQCWLWTGTKSNNYGSFSMQHEGRARNFRAHRVSLVIAGQTLDPELVVDHICRVTLCVRPEHLRQVTQAENSLCGIGPAAINARKTHCPRGHQLPPRTSDTDVRECAQCHGRQKTCTACGRSVTANNFARHRREYHELAGVIKYPSPIRPECTHPGTHYKGLACPHPTCHKFSLHSWKAEDGSQGGTCDTHGEWVREAAR